MQILLILSIEETICIVAGVIEDENRMTVCLMKLKRQRNLILHKII